MPGAEDGSDELLITNTLARITRLQQVLSDPSMAPLNQHITSAKLEWVRNYVKDNPGIPMLVFSKFRAPVMRLAEELNGALHVGSGGAVQIRRGVEEFRRGKSDILCGTIDALGEGLDLGRASRAIFIDQHWSTRAMQQAYDRIHRITADEPKHIIVLHVPHTVDELVKHVLEDGWSIQQMVYRALKEWEE